MKRELLKITKGLAELAQIVHDGLRDVRSEIQEVKTDLRVVKADVHGLKADVHGLKADVHGLKGEVKRLDASLRKLTTRFDDSLAQDEVARLERRTTTERLDNIERRLQRLEARPA